MKPRALVLLVALCSMLVPPLARAADPAIFQVGTAVRDVTPTTPQYLGGYGQMASGTTAVEDPLQVRAFFVGSGASAVAFAIVDSQGWFAGYQEGPWGVTDARRDAAAIIAGLGVYPSMTQANVIVSSTHSHAAPTIMGIWGPTDPDYLKLVHDQTVAALVAASQSARAAELWTGSGSIAPIIAHAVSSTDHYDGWSIDDDTPFLWAREPGTGATIGIYDNVPVHADSYKGSACARMSADTPGVVRSILEQKLGGTAVSAMGTLGRQETIGPSACGPAGVAEITRDGRFIANRIFEGLSRAHPITDPTVGGAEQYILTPGSNAILLALVYLNHAAPDCYDFQVAGACTIDRSIEPPYLVGSMLGTYVTSLRIGDNVWVSEPGEAFPEVGAAIRDSVVGAGAVHVVGMAQDQLGYYYPPEDYPSTEMYPSDFLIYNVGPELADANVRASAVNATLLGFVGVPLHPVSGNDRPHAYVEPGVQFFPIVVQSASTTVSFTGYSNRSGAAWLVNETPLPNPFPNSVSKPFYEFGDGQTATNMPEEFDHTYPGPGTYVARATTDDGNGQTRTFAVEIVIDEPPVAHADVTPAPGGCALAARITGGDAHVLAAHWSFSDGSPDADGTRVVRAAGPDVMVSVRAIDGVGDEAVATFPLSCQ